MLKSYIKIADQKFEESDLSEEQYMTINAQQEAEREAEKKEIGKKTTGGIEFKRKQALRYLRVMEF